MAQSACVSANAPRLLGLNLGMSPADASNVFGKDLKVKIKNTGPQSFFQNYINHPAPNALNGVRALYLRFLDAKLYQIEVFYEDRSAGQTLSDFTKELSAQMSFPESGWTFKQNKASIDCGEFSVFADKVLNPHVELTNKADLAKVEELRRKK